MHVKHLALGDCLKVRDDVPGAIAQFRKAQAFDDSIYVRERLAWIFATAPDPKLRDPAEAVRLAQSLIAQDPSNGHWRTALGAALLNSGDARGALVELGNAAKAKTVPSANMYLQAIALCRLGEKSRAQQAFQQANNLTAKISDPDVKRIAADAETELKQN